MLPFNSTHAVYSWMLAIAIFKSVLSQMIIELCNSLSNSYKFGIKIKQILSASPDMLLICLLQNTFGKIGLS